MRIITHGAYYNLGDDVIKNKKKCNRSVLFCPFFTLFWLIYANWSKANGVIAQGDQSKSVLHFLNAGGKIEDEP